jgi:hypothetical protein
MMVRYTALEDASYAEIVDMHCNKYKGAFHVRM